MKEKKDMILNQHSALTTFKLNEGNYYTIGVEKSIYALLFRAQQDMKKSFKLHIKEKLKKLVEEDNISNLVECIYSGKEFEIGIEDIDSIELKKLADEIVKYRKNEVYKRTGDENERKKLLSYMTKSFLFKFSELNYDIEKILHSEKKLSQSDKNPLTSFLEGKNPLKTSENIKSILGELKEYSKDIAIDEHMGMKNIDLTALSNSIDTNLTYLKKDMKNAVGTKLKFNYINRKKIDVDVVSTLIASVSFENDKLKRTTWMSYQIPIEILRLLLIPEIYVPLNGIAIQNLKGIYSFRMYGLLKDHIKRGEIELSREELFNFFMLPKSYENRTNFMNKFLDPTLRDVEENSGIQTKYRFIPERNWDKIQFNFKKVREVNISEVKIQTAEDVEKELNKNEEQIMNAVTKMRRNIYVSKAWNKNAENKIYRLVIEEGADFAVEVMNQVYKGLQTEITTTLVQYINGVIKKLLKESKTVGKIEKSKKERKPKALNEKKIKPAETYEEVVTVPQNNNISMFSREEEFEKNQKDQMSNLIYNMYLEMKDEKKLEILEKAKELFLRETGGKNINVTNEKIFNLIQKALIVRVITEGI